MTITSETLIEQTLAVRQSIAKILRAIPIEQSDTKPPTWSNNARWHAGHLIVTPELLTYGVMKEPLKVDASYRKWFAKGTSPDNWGTDSVPEYYALIEDIVPSAGRLFDSLKDRLDEPYLEPYTTSVGVVLRTPAEALNFSMFHDGIHLGLLFALKRALDTTHK